MHLYLDFSLFAVLITYVINYTEIRPYVRQAVLSIKKTEALDFSRVRVRLYFVYRMFVHMVFFMAFWGLFLSSGYFYAVLVV